MDGSHDNRVKAQSVWYQRGFFAPLANVDYRLLLTSNFLWWQARWMEMIITGWLVLELTDSAWQVALIGFYRSIPFLLVGPFSGPIIDRFGRRNCILVAQSVNFSISATIATLLWLDQLAIWHIIVGAVLMGVVWAVDWPARRSLIPDLVGKSQTVDGMMLEQMGQTASRIFGPFAGGAFIAAFGATGSYTFLAGTSACALLALLGITKQPIPRDAMPDASSPWVRIRDGFQYIRRNQSLRGVLAITVIMNALTFPYMELLPVFARDILDQGPLGLGLLGASNGIGAVIGLIFINRTRHILGNGWIMIGGTFLQSLLIIAFANSTLFPLSVALLICSGIGQSCFGVMQTSIMILSSSDEMRSRAMGTLVLGIGMGPFGRLQIGALAEGFGAALAVGLHGSVAAIAIVVVALLLPEFRVQGMTQGAKKSVSGI